MLLPNREECTGCGGCAAVCPKGCICMVADPEGFLYPTVDENQCIHCNKCEKACAVLQRPEGSSSVQIAAVQNVNTAVRQESSSGGVFTALAELVLREGGAVCAAAYDADFAVEHRIAFSVEEIAPMRGAKYTQSHAGHLFRQLQELLVQGKPVMFVGTPCQCAGLKSYLGKAYENLLLVDMICHGVPSPVVWENYVNQRRVLDANGSQVTSINLRDKSTGWSNYAYSVRFQYADGSVYSMPQGQDPYMRGFVGDLYLRPSCSRCSFKGISRCSDLTLGDCWGIWNTHPQFDDNKGTSLLLLQSEKGRKMWSRIQNGFHRITLTEEDVVKYNHSAVSASNAHPLREEFFARLQAKEPVDVLVRELLSPKPQRQSLLKRILRRVLSRR